MNPCACGYFGDPSGRVCTDEHIERYRRCILGPLLDRIDLHIEIARQRDWIAPSDSYSGETSTVVRKRVERARQIQLERQGKLNHVLAVTELKAQLSLDGDSRKFLQGMR